MLLSSRLRKITPDIRVSGLISFRASKENFGHLVALKSVQPKIINISQIMMVRFLRDYYHFVFNVFIPCWIRYQTYLNSGNFMSVKRFNMICKCYKVRVNSELWAFAETNFRPFGLLAVIDDSKLRRREYLLCFIYNVNTFMKPNWKPSFFYFGECDKIWPSVCHNLRF